MSVPVVYCPVEALHGLQLAFALEPDIVERVMMYVVVAAPAHVGDAAVLLALSPQALPFEDVLMVAIKMTVSSADIT